MLIKQKIIINKYLNIDIYDSKYDDTDNMSVTLNIEWQIIEMPLGLQINLYNINDISWSYTGINFTDDEDIKTDVNDTSDNSWNIIKDITTSCETDSIYIENVEIDYNKKQIIVTYSN